MGVRDLIAERRDDIARLAQLKSEFVTRLDMHSLKDNYVSVYFNPDSIWLSTNPMTSASRGTLESIRGIILRRRRWLADWARRRWLRFAPWLAGLGAIVVGLFVLKGNSPVTLTGTCLVLGGVFWHVWGRWVCRRRYSLIFLKKGPSDVSFWQRKQDETRLAMLAALLAGVASALTALWPRLFGAWSDLLRSLSH